MGGEAVLVYEGVRYAYPSMVGQERRWVLEGVTLSVERGHRLGILGANGGGKSTLLKLTVGLLRGQEGRIEVCGRRVEEAVRAGLVGYLPQRCEAELSFPVSARRVALMGAEGGLTGWRRLGASARAHVDRMLELVGASGYADRAIGALSGGQVQRVLIARALARRPEVLLLDEPMSGLDVSGQRRFSEMLERVWRETGVTLVVVSHDIRAIASSCDSIACLNRTLHSHTTPEGLTPEVLAEVFEHEVSAVFGGVRVEARGAGDGEGGGGS